ncbi:DASH complex subunit Ask1-domain-containing protein [Apodospora peruviana]|uniref:DASH complex subunit ASK1 n=1 Tax=Apodospora peruviana TaxID=516989 RepID=A0AAE0I4N8_9PEZI|nr:DASH complex subunit Ask1-domain-containing protein [Apodospora peruviana]
MSRPSQPAARNLSLTEELEKLEQSITLTLQEIDHNFSKAHRIVTTSILPLVEQYGEHSRSVWEASKFWKQFFEASANVSLSGYEELANGEDSTTLTTEEETTVQDETTADYTPRPRSADGRDRTNNDNTFATDRSSVRRGHGRQHSGADESLLSDADCDVTGSTPRPPASKILAMRPQFAGLDSPYEALKREFKTGDTEGCGHGNPSNADDDETDTELLFQQHTARLPDMSMTPRSTLGAHGAANEGGGDDDTQFGQRGKNKDPLLHRMLDKNYRVMATPHRTGMATGVSPIKWKVTEKPPVTTSSRDEGKGKDKVPIWQDSPMSSPEMAVPQLRSAAFMSPMRAAYRGKAGTVARGAAPRTPGVSVQTPVAGRKVKDVYSISREHQYEEERPYEDEITWESDSEGGGFGGMSPPKTIQFALPPSKLLQTPAREASKRIVDNILLTAGAEPDGSSEYSPTMVKMNPDILDDAF